MGNSDDKHPADNADNPPDAPSTSPAWSSPVSWDPAEPPPDRPDFSWRPVSSKPAPPPAPNGPTDGEPTMVAGEPTMAAGGYTPIAAGYSRDDLLERLAPPPASHQLAAQQQVRKRLLIGGLAAVAAVLFVLVVVVFAVAAQGGDDAEDAPFAATTAAPQSGSSVAAGGSGACPARTEGSTVHGNGAGGTGSGPEAILGFQHAYYVDRSGEKARSFVAPDGAVLQAPQIQDGINTVPAGSTHCLAITSTGGDRYTVQLTERRPDGTTTVYKQVVTTVARDGKTLIKEIAVG